MKGIKINYQFFFLYFFVALFFEIEGYGQSPATLIVLKPEYLKITPNGYYYKDVQDKRNAEQTIGRIFTSKESKETEPLGLQGGTEKALRDYIFRSVPKDRLLKPVVLEVNKCEISEKRALGGLIEGKVDLEFTFQLEKEGKLIHLMDYQGGANYKRSSGNYSAVSSSLKQSLASSLRYFNEWMSQGALNDIRLANSVELSIRDYEVRELGDTVFYHQDRPLKWEDFKAKPHFGSNYVASIFSSFAWEGNSKIKDGVIVLDLVTKVFMLKPSSWVRSGSRDDYGLNHEQRHFDITKIIVERFKEKIKKLELSPDDYDGKIGYLYLETYREMNQMQEAYDKETDHGRDKEAQYRWNGLIDKELGKYFP